MQPRASQPDLTASAQQRRSALDHRLPLWLIDSDSVAHAQLQQEGACLLSPDEAVRWKRYGRPEDQHLFLVAHVLVRRVLSLYASITPADWSFVVNEHGRPEIDPTQQPSAHDRGGPVLRFNLSHTAGMVGLLIHDEVDAGVDVERLGRIDDPLALSATVFADQERASLQGIGSEELEDRFYRLWTLKEAFIKAKGMGLAIPLKDFWFWVDDPSMIQMGCLPAVDDDPARWRFAYVETAATHRVAVARAAGGRTLDVITLSPDGLLDLS